jgi:exonuclease III
VGAAGRGGGVGRGPTPLSTTFPMTLTVNNMLLDLNANPELDFLLSHNTYLSADENVNPYENLTITSQYHDTSSFLHSFSSNKSPIFLNINIQSLNSKFENLKQLILSFQTKNVLVPVIALQEIWQIPYPELVSIPGYKFIHKQRSKGRGGGVGFFLSQNIHYKILHDLSPFIEKSFESLSIEITLNNKRMVLTNIYRPPIPLPGLSASEHITNFIDNLDNLASELSSLNKPSFILSDTNINLHNTSTNHLTELYSQSLYSNGFIQTILKSTRIQTDSHSLIDHICTNIPFTDLNTGIIVSDLSDHFINFIQLPFSNFLKRKTPPKPTRLFSLDNHQRFKTALSQISWHETLNLDDVNLSFEAFWNTFKDLFDIHFPSLIRKTNRNIQKLNPFMTTGLLISRTTKNKLYIKSISHPTDSNISLYKTYRNIYNTLILLF